MTLNQGMEYGNRSTIMGLLFLLHSSLFMLLLAFGSNLVTLSFGSFSESMIDCFQVDIYVPSCIIWS
uniref:Uncharacterized protein n=1 Tax=Acrobeloides nanus TaxID=290746 RepID=A0A914C010_9BILA